MACRNQPSSAKKKNVVSILNTTRLVIGKKNGRKRTAANSTTGTANFQPAIITLSLASSRKMDGADEAFVTDSKKRNTTTKKGDAESQQKPRMLNHCETQTVEISGKTRYLFQLDTLYA